MSPDPDVSSVVQSTQHLSTSPWVPGIGAIFGQVCKPQGKSWPRELPPALLVCILLSRIGPAEVTAACLLHHGRCLG